MRRDAAMAARVKAVKDVLFDALHYLALAVRRIAGARLTFVIGDSHALFLCGAHGSSLRRIRPTRFPGVIVLWLGPKLLHSLATRGFPAWVRILMARRLALGGRANVCVDIVAGEIDVRCHLAPRVAADGPAVVDRLVEAFVAQLRRCADGGVAGIRYYEPVPPSDAYADNPEFPRAGSLAERIRCHRLLADRIRQSIEDAARTGYPFRFVANPEEAVLADGAMNPLWSDDGCHFNQPTFRQDDGALAPGMAR